MRSPFLIAFLTCGTLSFGGVPTVFHVTNAGRRPVVVVAQTGHKSTFRPLEAPTRLAPKAQRDLVPFAKAPLSPKLTYRVVVNSPKGTELGHVDFSDRVLAAGTAKGVKFVVQNGSVLVNVGSRRFRVILLPENFVRE